jgi:hypothetical protein
VLANDTDIDGDALTADLVSQPGGGSLQLAPDGGFTYTPQAGFSGTDTFTYRAADATSFSAPATVTLTVVAPADPGVPEPEPPASVADTDPPETSITRAPPKRSEKRNVKIGFGSNELGSTFQCRLDDKPFSPCSSPATVRAKPGKHTFLVQATDAAGNRDATPAQAKFKVVP